MAAKKSKKAVVKTATASSKAAPSYAHDDIAMELIGGLRAAEGDDVAMFLGADSMAFRIRGVISSQCPALDAALGRGGYPLGRITIFHGKEGSGKTTLALHAVAEVQRMGGVAFYIDREYALDPEYARSIGVDTDRMIISQDGALEDIINRIFSIVDLVKAHRARTGTRLPVLVVLDSINSAIAKCRIEGNPGDAHVAPEARLWSSELPKLVEKLFHEDICLILISQVRKKMNVQFGDPDEIAGGEAPKFYASVILKITPVGASRENSDGDAATGEDKEAVKVGYFVEVEAKKNKVAPPFRKARFLIRYGVGVDFYHSMITVAVQHGIMKTASGWFSYDGVNIAQGAIKTAKALATEPYADMSQAIYSAFREMMGWGEAMRAEEAEATEEAAEATE